MALSLSFLILTLIKGSESVNTITKVSVQVGASVRIPCSYDSKYINHVKYLCRGYYWNSCSYEVRTDSPRETGTHSISDDKIQRIFTVTIKQLTADTYYWCNVESDKGGDDGQRFHLSVNKGTPILWVADQNVTGFIGDEININFNSSTSGGIKWCKLDKTCVTEPTGMIDGTTVTIKKDIGNVISVTMSGLKQENSGWYYCDKGEFQMPVHLTVTVKPTGSKSVNTITKVSVKVGASVRIPCSYDSKYINHVKYLCKGYHWNSCSYEVRTNSPRETGMYSISDDKIQRIFTVTIKQLTADTYYWCNVEINKGGDDGQRFHLSINKSTPILWVADQNVTGFIGDKININFNSSTSGGIKWCKLDKTCVTEPTGIIDGTTVTIKKDIGNVISVTMSGLKQENSGWYYCDKGDFQMPVHLTVTVKPTGLRTTTETIKVTGNSAATGSTDPGLGEIPNQRSSVDQSIHITLAMLSLIVLVALLMWFIQRCKNTKEDLTNPKSNEWEIVFTAVRFKLESTPQSEANEEDVTYSTVVYHNDCDI